MADELNKQLDYLINNLKAYKGFPHVKGLRNSIKSHLYRWGKQQEGMTIMWLPILREDLWKKAQAKKMDENLLKQDWQQFQLLPANENHLQIEDNRGRLLAYRVRLPEKLYQGLVDTEPLIPPKKVKSHSRGTTVNRHWGLWRKYSIDLHMSGNYLRDLPNSQQWLNANKDLFQYLTDVLRLLDPQMYIRYISIKDFLPPDIQPACGAWYACAINQDMTMDGIAHLDRSNYYCGLNVVVGWGDYTSSKLVLWDLGLVLELLPGDAILFLGRIITHNTVDIQGGVRNLVNCFVHQTPLSWKDKKVEELTSSKRRGGPGKYDKKGKGKQVVQIEPKEKKRKHEDSNVDIGDLDKGKQKQIEESDGEMDEEMGGILNTDDEMEIMYAAHDGEDEESD
ncbi:MAG: hypothetical protein M1840_000995 [Geoglossum simile]|nr:MAG: hypothetical protein M1840_000995 [Geoglossum simile]